MQVSQEELKSANEELQSTNEELQSTDEELTTSKEEMQSMNEELETTNQELRAKVEELSRASDDMKNLLNSTDIATLFLDTDLRGASFHHGRRPDSSSSSRVMWGGPSRILSATWIILDWPRMRERCCGRWSSTSSRRRARDGRWFTGGNHALPDPGQPD